MVESTKSKQGVTLFQHLNAIYEKQDKDYWDNLEDADRKTFSVYMINRFVSMNPDYLPVANEIQQYWGQVGPREVYLLYSQILPKKRQFNKYIKGSKDSFQYENWIRERIAQHYQVSETEAEKYLQILYLSTEGKTYLRELLEGYGAGPKQLKKAGL